MPEDLIGTVIKQRYRLTRWIHTSATGDVFEATDQKLFGQAVALKILNQILPGNIALSGYLRRRFEEEARISIQLGGHPHIAQVKDFDLEGERPFLVLELLGAPPLIGRHLGDLLESTGPLTLERFLKLAKQICSALHYAHCYTSEIEGTPVRGVIHRDIKPANLFVVQDPVLGETVKVLDFGVAKLISDVTINLGTNLFGFVGTLSHASPEQMQGKALDPRTDIYSLGIVLYQMLSGHLPLQAETETFPGWYEAHNFQQPRSLTTISLPWRIPEALDAVILSCLSKQSQQRPETMQILSHQLERAIHPRVGSLSSSAPASPPAPAPSSPSPQVSSTSAPVSAPPLDPSSSRREFVRPNPRPIIPTVGKEGRYRIEKHLGSGGMGEVYLATDTTLNRQVAVKIMTGNASEDPRILVKRFKREVDVCASLNSPHIVQVTDFGTTEHKGGYPFFVMEYLQGETLGQLLARTGKLPLDRALRIMAQVCLGLSEAHHRNIVHRDLKPDNIFLIPGTLWELVKVLDFGVAKVMNQAEETVTKLTVVGAYLGTLCYSSPEQCVGQGEVDQCTDIYSLGVILYEVLSGTNPFNLEVTTARDNFLWIDAHVHAEPIPLDQQPGCEGIPPVITEAVMRCLRKSPADRFPSVDPLLEILHATLQNKDLVGVSLPPNLVGSQTATGPRSSPISSVSIASPSAQPQPQPQITTSHSQADSLDETIVEERISSQRSDPTIVEKPLRQLLGDETYVESTPQSSSSETIVEHRVIQTQETIIEPPHHRSRSAKPVSPPPQPSTPPRDRVGTDTVNAINFDPEPTGSITRPVFDRERYFPKATPAPPSLANETSTELGGIGVPRDEEEDWDDDDEVEEELLSRQDPHHREQRIETEIGQISHILNPSPASTPAPTPPQPIWRYLAILVLCLVTGGAIFWGVTRALNEQEDPRSWHPDPTCASSSVCLDRHDPWELSS